MSTLPPLFLELINGTLLVLFFWVVFWFGYDIYSVSRSVGSWRQTYEESAASIACFVAFTGDSVIRGSVWYYRHLQNDGIDVSELEKIMTLLIAMGVVIAIFGCGCIIHHLAPPSLGRLPWAIAVLTALAFGIGMAL
jgi:hypothetical protein